MCNLDLILSNETRIRFNYLKYDIDDRFLLIKRILLTLHIESDILLKNYNIIKNADVTYFDDLKKNPKIPCIYCGEFFKTNFDLSVHLKSKQCVQDNEQTCSFCLHENIKDHRNKNHRPVECILCGALVKG
jgi:hypothetical protein